jgi:hypothetical protein
MAVDVPTLVGSSSSRTAVTGAIRQAAQVTGTSFDYLLATAKVESDLNPNLTMRSSSATGLFQFLDQTWLATLKQGGPAFGYGAYANAIARTPSGRYVVADPSLRGEIMRLRKDPTANALMGGVVTQLNAAQLAKRIGRAPSEGELYIAHFFGPYAAAKAIKLAGSDPTANAAAIFPAAAAANRPIFHDKQGNARSIAGVCAELMRRYQVARAPVPTTSRQVAAATGSAPPRPPALIPASAPTVPRLAPPLSTSATAALGNLMFSSSPLPTAMAFANDTAGVTSAYAAAAPPARPPETGSVFRSLFHDEGRRGAVAPVVSELWGNQAAAGEAARSSVPPTSRKPGGGSTLDLFRDAPADARGLFDGGKV